MIRKFKLVNLDKRYSGEVYGYLSLDTDKDSGELYLLDNYVGLHAGYVLAMYRKSGIKVLKGTRFNTWLSLRVCPSGRHNIKDILKKYNFSSYNATKIYIANGGRNDRDNMVIEEIPSSSNLLELSSRIRIISKLL